MQSCDTVVQCPFTSTHLMLPYYTERRPSENLINTMGYTYSYHSKKFICTWSHHLRMLMVLNSEAEIFNILKLS